jgi:hypothetical protein
MNQPQFSNYDRAGRSVIILFLSLGIYVWVAYTIYNGEFQYGDRSNATRSLRITPESYPWFFWGWEAGWTAAALLLDIYCLRDLIQIRRAARHPHADDA